jgi:hypothetical protein
MCTVSIFPLQATGIQFFTFDLRASSPDKNPHPKLQEKQISLGS